MILWAKSEFKHTFSNYGSFFKIKSISCSSFFKSLKFRFTSLKRKSSPSSCFKANFLKLFQSKLDFFSWYKTAYKVWKRFCNDFSFSTGNSASYTGLIFDTVSFKPVPTASRFLVLLLISSDLAAKNLTIKNEIPFPGIRKLLNFFPFSFDLMDIFLALLKLAFELIDDSGNFFFDLIKVLIWIEIYLRSLFCETTKANEKTDCFEVRFYQQEYRSWSWLPRQVVSFLSLTSILFLNFRIEQLINKFFETQLLLKFILLYW